jgi:hypothetical protein
MSQADQVALWESVRKGTLQAETTTFQFVRCISGWSNAQNAFVATFSPLLCYLLLGNFGGYKNISTRLKLGPFEEDGLVRTASTERQHQQSSDEPESPGFGKPCILFCSGLSTVIRD